MTTILHRLADWAETNPGQVAQRFRDQGQWKDITAREMWDRVFYLALFLESKGFTQDDLGVIFSYNNPQWVHMDLAPLLLGARSCGIYPNSNHKDIEYILNNTACKLFTVQNANYFKKAVGAKHEYPLPESVEMILVMDDDTSISKKAVAYSDALKQGRALAQGKNPKDYLKKIDKNQGAFLIYTSGTTGNPKGALLSHDNLIFASDLALNQFQLPRDGTMFSFLPLCHVAEKLQNIGVGICGHYTVHFCSSIDNVAKELPDVQPTLLLCVPRLWEKMVEGVQHKLEAAPPLKKKLANWAFAVANRVAEARFSGKSPNPIDVAQLAVADALVLKNVRQKLGLSKILAAASGAAALSVSVEKWFRCIGINILNTYGQTESTGLITMAVPGIDCSGSIGKPAPGTEFKIAADGEILSKGRTVFVGYFKNDEATRETIKDGWLHTGDLGAFDERGMVVIRGRKKEIMKTSGGKMVAPLPIEERIKQSPLISQVCMVGDGRKYLAALVTLAPSVSSTAGNGKIVTDPKVVSEVGKVFEELNKTLASYEQIKRFTVLANEFSVDQGEMTPTLKMKRNIIEKNYDDVIEQMYNG